VEYNADMGNTTNSPCLSLQDKNDKVSFKILMEEVLFLNPVLNSDRKKWLL
jgi:hypothetical protein